MEKDLLKPINVPFEKLFLDPNNPRIAADTRPGYEDSRLLFASDVQTELSAKVKDYDVSVLEESIVNQGWVPIDSILVWEHHKEKGHFVVVEGNRRTVTLREIRNRLGREKDKLSKMQAGKRTYTKQDIDEQSGIVARIEQVIRDTSELLVYPVNASTPAQLEERLPRLMGVRHVTHAKEWSPYASGLYMRALYAKLFEEKHGADKALVLEQDLINQVASSVSVSSSKVRRGIQAASAFTHFRIEFADKLPKDEELTHQDHYFFEQILDNKYARDQFDFGSEKLRLDPEMENVLFEWAFKLPRKGDPNPNILRIAEDIRLWAQMKRYDDKKGTAFAAQLSVEQASKAAPMEQVEPEYLAHKARVSPVDTLRALQEAFMKVSADTLVTQGSHLRPMLLELVKVADQYIRMIDAAGKSTRSAGESVRTA